MTVVIPDKPQHVPSWVKDLTKFWIKKQIAEKSKKELEDRHVFGDPIVTEIVPLIKFYLAEEYHKKYYDQNKNAPYCRFVIDPKVAKLLKQYGNELKPEFIQ